MTQEEIIEGNKLIGLFMGAEPTGKTFSRIESGQPSLKQVREAGFVPEYKLTIPTPGEPWIKKREVFLTFEPSCHTQKASDILQYHTSFDWLMPVVEKIESHDHYVWIMYSKYDGIGKINQVSINSMEIPFPSGNAECAISVRDANKLKATYQAVVQYIQYYNHRKTPSHPQH